MRLFLAFFEADFFNLGIIFPCRQAQSYFFTGCGFGDGFESGLGEGLLNFIKTPKKII